MTKSLVRVAPNMLADGCVHRSGASRRSPTGQPEFSPVVVCYVHALQALHAAKISCLQIPSTVVLGHVIEAMKLCQPQLLQAAGQCVGDVQLGVPWVAQHQRGQPGGCGQLCWQGPGQCTQTCSRWLDVLSDNFTLIAGCMLGAGDK